MISKQYRYIETYADESLQKIAFAELYDQIKDPGEMANLVDQKKYLKKVREFRALIQDHKNDILKNNAP